MDVKQYLISTHGLSEDEAKVIADNPKYASIYEKAAKEAEDGKTAFLKAQETKTALEQWNQNTVIPYVQKADNEIAKIKAEKAAMAAHMAELKARGYEIPDAYLADTPPTPGNNVPPAPSPGKDYDDLIQKGQLAQMELIDLANEAYDLTGKRVSVNSEYREFSKEARPGETLRSYVTRKYDLENIRSTRSKEAEQKKLDDYAAVKVAAEKAEWAKSHGTNGETRIPQNSRFDKVVESRKADGNADKDGRPLWQTQAGREEARKNRLDKYAGLVN
jgi:hypothetical protein